jgi:hypothetical protein
MSFVSNSSNSGNMRVAFILVSVLAGGKSVCGLGTAGAPAGLIDLSAEHPLPSPSAELPLPSAHCDFLRAYKSWQEGLDSAESELTDGLALMVEVAIPKHVEAQVDDIVSSDSENQLQNISEQQLQNFLDTDDPSNSPQTPFLKVELLKVIDERPEIKSHELKEELTNRMKDGIMHSLDFILGHNLGPQETEVMIGCKNWVGIKIT